jgi:hypothetical protein
MEVELDYTKSAQQNAEAYFERAKSSERKRDGAERAAGRLEQQLSRLEKESVVRKEVRKKRESEWYEKFYWFFTSTGLLAIGGRSAQQNEEVVAKYFQHGDLFFHASIFGASVVILKKGEGAPQQARDEAAQFAACFSKAWETGQSSVDVFAAKHGQVSKSEGKGYLATGSFLISGEREWHKGVRLELAAAVEESTVSLQKQMGSQYAYISLSPLEVHVDTGRLAIMPFTAYAASGKAKGLRLLPGKTKKSDAAKQIAKRLGYGDVDYIMQHLPPGGFEIG